ncbi:MAG: tRNA(Leu) C34 or U34 (ribose-2'-O)-methylase TrmL [Oleiphilaceae bacterium]|jgi:tRNA(Leu) C34 or U34 (ribose-2'-O)-methylase TrmL
MSEFEINIGLSNPKNPTNVGVVMRAASCFQASAVFYTGDRYDRAARFYTDTQDTTNTTPLLEVNCLIESVPKDTKMVCVELVEGATSLPEYHHPNKAFYIFGPEDGTLSQEMIDRADSVVYIPTVGCLNVAMAVNVVLYDRLVKSGCSIASNDLICQSRNINNRVKVKTELINTL